MNHLRRNPLPPLGVGTAAVAAAIGLVVGGTGGAILAAGVLVCGATGAAALVLRRSQRAQLRRLGELTEAVASLEQAVGRVGKRQGALSERVDDGLTETRTALTEVRKDLIAAERRSAARHTQAERWAEAAAQRNEPLTASAARVAADLASVRADLERLRLAGRDAAAEAGRRVYGKVEDLLALYRDIDPVGALPHTQGWAAGVDLVRYLYTQVTERGRTRVLECGSGSSTVMFAYAMRQAGEGRVVALEHEPRFAEATRGMLRERGLEEWAEVVDAPLTPVTIADEVWDWYDLKAIPDGEFDLVVVDGPPGKTGPQARYPALPMLLDRLASDAAVVLDDAFRPEERATADRWSEEFSGFERERISHERGTIVLRRADGGERRGPSRRPNARQSRGT